MVKEKSASAAFGFNVPKRASTRKYHDNFLHALQVRGYSPPVKKGFPNISFPDNPHKNE